MGASRLEMPRGSAPRRTSPSTAILAVVTFALLAVGAVGSGAVVSEPQADALTGTTWHVGVDGSDSALGTAGAPLATISEAVRRSVSGDKVVVGPGRYHEQVQVYEKDVDIRGAGVDITVLDGTRELSHWAASDGRWWTPWSTNFRRADDIQTTPSRREAGYPEQFFLDGVALLEVKTLDEVVTGTFFNDIDLDRVYIGNDPTGRLVEGSDLQWGIYLNRAHGSSISHLTVQRYATPQASMAAIRMYGDQLQATDVATRWNAYGGISAIGTDISLSHVTADRNGQTGIHGHASRNLSVTHATIIENNVESFDPSWAAGGLKVTSTDHFTITDSVVDRNLAPAIWIDLDVTNTVIARNMVRDNMRSGLMFELSSDIVAVDNLIVGNGQAGLYVLESQRVELWHNAVFDNHWDLRILTGPRDDVDDIDVFNNSFGGSVPSGQAVLHADDWTANLSAEQMNIDWDHNRIWWPTTSAGAWISRIQNWPAPQSLSTTMQQHRAAVGGEDASSEMSRVDTNPYARAYLAGDGRAPEGSTVGAPLPAHIAAAAGMQTGAAFAPGALSGIDPAPPPTTTSTTSTTTSSTAPPRAAVQVPTGVTAQPGSRLVDLTWRPPIGGPTPDSYIVYVDGRNVASTTLLSTTLALDRSRTSVITVQAVAPDGSRSAQSTPITVAAHTKQILQPAARIPNDR